MFDSWNQVSCNEKLKRKIEKEGSWKNVYTTKNKIVLGGGVIAFWLLSASTLTPGT